MNSQLQFSISTVAARGRASWLVLWVWALTWFPVPRSADAVAGEESEEVPYANPVRVGLITDSRIREPSGMVPVSGREGFYWIHNDSKSEPDIYAVREDGVVIAEVRVTGASLSDWEDIACGPGPVPDRTYLFIADTGNNSLNRQELVVYRFPEPILESTSPGQVLKSEEAETIRFRYPDGVFDNESLIVHPQSGELYVITKVTGTAGVYRFPVREPGQPVQTLVRVGSMRTGSLVTAADLSADGRRLLVRTFAEVHEYRSAAGASFEAIFAQPKRILPDSPAETKSESICFHHNDRDYLTTNESNPAPIHRARARTPQPMCAPPSPVELPFTFVRGDVARVEVSEGEETVDVADAVALVDLLRGTSEHPCPDSADFDDDGVLGDGDVGAILDSLLAGDEPPPPFSEAGLDPTSDDLGCAEASRVELIADGARWKYWNATTAAPAGWQAVDVDDGTWQEGPSGIGYGSDALRTVLSGGSRLGFYARVRFAVGEGAFPDALLLSLDYSDGFVAYVNGIEVARRGLGIPGFEVPYGQSATTVHPGGQAEDFYLCTTPLRKGLNVLALELHSRSAFDASLFFRARLLGLRAAPPPPEPPVPSLRARFYLEADSPPNVGDRGVLRVLCDSSEPFRACSFALQYDPSVFEVLEASPGEATSGAARTGVKSERGSGLISSVFLADLPHAGRKPFSAGEGLELARLEYSVKAEVAGETTVAFTERAGPLPFGHVVATVAASSVRPAVEDLPVEITAIRMPVIHEIHGGRGPPGHSFFVVGRRFDSTGLSVTVCGRAAEFELLADNESLVVVAPSCHATGFAAVEVCNEEGCSVKDEGFFYTDVGRGWIRGDANGDERVDISDAITLLGQLFLGVPASPACDVALDANSDGLVDISDSVFLLAFLFQGLGEIGPPYPEPDTCP